MIALSAFGPKTRLAGQMAFPPKKEHSASRPVDSYSFYQVNVSARYLLGFPSIHNDELIIIIATCE